MKFIVMLLALYMLTDPVLADESQNDAECLAMHHNYLTEKNISRAQMFYFLEKCAPVNTANNPARSNQLQHQKLLQVIDVDKRTRTSKV